MTAAELVPPGAGAAMPLVAVIPAAGRSRRMGRSKPLLPLGDSDFIGTIVAALRDPAVDARRIVVVHRADDEALAARLAALASELGAAPAGPFAGAPLLQTAVVAPGAGDMLASIRAGWAAAREAPAGSEPPPGALVWPVDAPLVALATVRVVAARARQAPGVVARPLHEGQPGHPLWAPAALLEASSPSGAAPGLRGLLEALALPVTDLPVRDPDCLLNLNTPELYALRCGPRR